MSINLKNICDKLITKRNTAFVDVYGNKCVFNVIFKNICNIKKNTQKDLIHP